MSPKLSGGKRKASSGGSQSPPKPRTSILQQLITERLRVVLMLVLLAIGLFAGQRWVWNSIGPQITASDMYRLHPERMTVTEQPDWIRADVKAEVVRDASLDQGLSMLDDQLVERIAEAFAFHPWVARVERVTKAYPALVQVELIYRRPVVMVSLEGSSSLELFPVDVEGVHLPSSDFSSLEKGRFPRLVGIDTLPLVGERSHDPRVQGGARLAAYLGEVWESFHLARIVPVPPTEGDRERFEVITRQGTRIIWGAAPGMEPEGEPQAEDKLARLREHLKQFGTLDNSQHGELNVRDFLRSRSIERL